MSIRVPFTVEAPIRDAFLDVEQRLRELEAREDPTEDLEIQIQALRDELERLRTRRNSPDPRDIMVASGTMHSPGLVPDPPSTAGTTKFLREDGTWVAVVGGGGTSPLTTKGDIWGYTTTDARVGVGLNDTVLKADSGQAAGVIWEKVNASEVVNVAAGNIAATDVQAAINELDSEKVDLTGDSMTGTLAIAETAGSTRHSSLQVYIGGVTGSQNVRIANKKVADVDSSYNFWQTPLTIYNDFGSATEAMNSGTTGINTGLRIIAGTNNPSAAEGTPGANSIVGATIFSANGSLTDPIAIWGTNILVHYFRSPNADPTSGLYMYGQEVEVIHNTASDHISDPYASVSAGETRSCGLQVISHSDNPKKVTSAITIDAGGYTLGSGGRAGTNWWKTGLALTRCSEQGILFDVRADEVGTAFATAALYMKGVPANTNLLRSDIATTGVYLPYAGDVNFNFYNSADQNLYVGIGSGDGTPVKECGVKLYDSSTLKWSLLKTSSNTFVLYDNVNSLSKVVWNPASTGSIVTTAQLNYFDSSASFAPQIILRNTNADQYGPYLLFNKLSASMADDDNVGNINFQGYNDAGSPETISYAAISSLATDISDGTEDGNLQFQVMNAGSLTTQLRIAPGTLEVYVDGSLKSVSVGTNDSGGTGYKVLRVPN